MSLPSPSEQVAKIKEIIDSPFVVGEKAFVISKTWLKGWKDSIGFDGSEANGNKVGPINNNAIVQNDKLIESTNDYEVLNEKTFKLLYKWYGGGPFVSVPIYENDQGLAVPVTKLFNLKINYKNEHKNFEANPWMKVKDFHIELRKLFNVPENEETCVREYLNKQVRNYFHDDDFLEKYHLVNRMDILLDYKEENGKWNSDHLKTPTAAPIADQKASPTKGKNMVIAHNEHQTNIGVVGFYNLGNTCFFNSGIQCLIHTRPLVKYMLSDDWEADLNLDNPIGMKGRIAKAFVKLVHDYWSGKLTKISPNELKHVIGEYAPRFKGWGQQDSHELVLTALDGIHEDLNRCKKKKYVEGIEGNGTNDEEIAMKSWNIYKQRNDSIIVDLFHGQLRSRLICPKCHSTVVLFDPYMSIPMPINPPHSTQLTAIYIPYDYNIPCQTIKLIIPSSSNSLTESITNEISNFLPNKKPFGLILALQIPDGLSYSLKGEIDRKIIYAFEVPDLGNKIYMPCLIQMKYKAIGRPFLIDITELPDKFDSKSEEFKQKIEDQLSVIWTPPKDIKLTDEQETLKKKLESYKYKGHKKFKAIIKKPYSYNNTKENFKALSKDNNNITSSFCFIEINTTHEEFTYEGLLFNHYDNKMKEEYNQKELVTLNQCFKYFSQPEVLDEKNQWHCSKCNEFVNAEKKFDIWSVPQILIIQLKRFYAAGNFYGMKKLNHYVDFPDEIDMRQYIIGPQKNDENLKYRLFAISNHMGGLGGGHYTAYAKVQDPESLSDEYAPWYNFNDSFVSTAQIESVHSSSAYLLFYERIDLK